MALLAACGVTTLSDSALFLSKGDYGYGYLMVVLQHALLQLVPTEQNVVLLSNERTLCFIKALCPWGVPIGKLHLVILGDVYLWKCWCQLKRRRRRTLSRPPLKYGLL